MNLKLHKLKAQSAVLKDVLVEYPTATIENAIKQIEARIKEIESPNKE